MAELMGRANGLCQGLGGSMHLVDIDHGFLGATGVVGGNLPLALGTALAARTLRTDRVTVAFFGDGAVQAGHFHESVNLAALWGLPVIFVCENNGFAEFTSRTEHSLVERVSDVVAPYGLQRATVDGSDALAVWDAFAEFLTEARAGQGPMLLECLTHRRRGHYEGDSAAVSRSTGGGASGSNAIRWRACASERSRRLGSTAEAAQALGSEAEAEIEAAVAFGRDSPFPGPEIPGQLVYADVSGSVP